VRGAAPSAATPHAPRCHRLRLLLAEDGTVSIEISALDDFAPDDAADDGRPVTVALAAEAISSRDPFLHHKTTHREIYRQALLARPGVDDVILWNERGEVTETTIANLVLDLDGERVTPAVSSGLLEGTFRRRLLAEGAVTERVVTLDDLSRARAIWLVNSVRGFRRAELTRP
jgi:para-aminobenzoate synthetase/4-amino-4-deoxychorismate lyase